MNIQQIETNPIDGQKCGTSGLRKKVKLVMETKNYLQNFCQCIFDTLQLKNDDKNRLVIGGDGRFYNKQAIQTILSICLANNCDEVHVGQNGLFSTPAISHYIRKNKLLGGFILTASHNPGGIENDFGIKFNNSTGGPAQEEFTERAYEHTRTIKQYSIVENFQQIDLSEIRDYTFVINVILQQQGKNFTVKIVDPVKDYVQLMQDQFNFDQIKTLVQRNDFKFKLDGMNGIAGPYAKCIFVDILKVNPESLLNCEPKEDFGGYLLIKGVHPDPNLVYAEELVSIMFNKDTIFEFGAACDGDADRNMILGKNFFVTPSDSLAVMAANASAFMKNTLIGVARSMPTSGAIDKVAQKLNIPLFETPTGWKFFGNLMDANKINLCGEESFGTGSNHIREKDGLWAILTWLSILAYKNVSSEKLVTVEEILNQHWHKFGRNYYCRFDYESVSSEGAKNMMDHLLGQFSYFESLKNGNKADVFEYHDPIDHSISKNQGLRFIYEDGSRIIFRLSGTGSGLNLILEGATIRLYFEKYESESIHLNNQEALKQLIDLAMDISKIKEFTQRNEPSVIT